MSDYQVMDQQQPNFPVNQVPRNLVTVTQIVYFLHGLSIVLGVFSGASIATAFVFGWPSIIAVIINYVKRSDVQGTYLASHFTWQIRTFWYAFWWIIFVWVVGFFLAFILVGLAVWFIGFIVLGIWVCYLIIRGWLRLSDGLPMPIY